MPLSRSRYVATSRDRDLKQRLGENFSLVRTINPRRISLNFDGIVPLPRKQIRKFEGGGAVMEDTYRGNELSTQTKKAT